MRRGAAARVQVHAVNPTSVERGAKVRRPATHAEHTAAYRGIFGTVFGEHINAGCDGGLNARKIARLRGAEHRVHAH